MTFGQILSRGTWAANRTKTALLLYILLLGLFQGISVVVGGLLTPEAFQIQPGGDPPPQIFLLIAFGCFSCFYGLLAIFGTPWVTGGAVGQMRDRIIRADGSADPFREHAGSYYWRMLVLGLIWMVIFVVMWFILFLVGAAIVGAQGAQFDPQNWQELNTHPANIASGVVFMLALSALGVWFSIAEAIIVADDQSGVAALGQACRFCLSHAGDAFKMFLLFVALAAVFVLAGQVPALIDEKTLPVMAVVGLFLAVYFP